MGFVLASHSWFGSKHQSSFILRHFKEDVVYSPDDLLQIKFDLVKISAA